MAPLMLISEQRSTSIPLHLLGGGMAGEIQIGQLTFVGKYVIYLEKPESVNVAFFGLKRGWGEFGMDCWQFCMSSSITVIV